MLVIEKESRSLQGRREDKAQTWCGGNDKVQGKKQGPGEWRGMQKARRTCSQALDLELVTSFSDPSLEGSSTVRLSSPSLLCESPISHF